MLIVALVVILVIAIAAFLEAREEPSPGRITHGTRMEAEAAWRGRAPVIEVAGRPASLKTRAKNHPDTVLTVGDLDPHRGDLRLFESGRKRPGEEDRLVGDAGFDRAWAVQGGEVRRFFGAEVREEVIAAVQALRHFKRPRVAVGPEGLEIRIKDHLKTSEERKILLRAAEVLTEALRARAEPTGLLWMESREDAPALCQVCGVDIRPVFVLCRACRTPHHEDCWRYSGRCSTYGCGERNAVRA